MDGEYSGVYLQNSNLEGKAIRTINQLGFSYTGIATAGRPASVSASTLTETETGTTSPSSRLSTAMTERGTSTS